MTKVILTEIYMITFLKLDPKLPCANKHAEDRGNGKMGVKPINQGIASHQYIFLSN